ncbi:MAG: SNF2-related protein, partial [Bacteroidales bacterium]
MKSTLADASLQFVFAWVVHPVLGNVIEAYALHRLPSGHFSYEYYRITAVTVDDYFPGATDAQRQILALTDKYSEEVLQKKFRPGKQKSRTFYETLEADFVEEHIRPYIDRYLYQAAGLLFEHQIPLYFKGAKNERIQEQELYVMPEMAEALFIFDRQEQETHYSLQMLYQGEPVALNDVEALLLAKKPCLLKIDDRIFRFLPEWNGRKLVPFFNKEYIVIPKSSEKKYFQSFVLNAVKKYPVKAMGFTIQEVNKAPVPWLSVETNWKGHWVFQLYFNYPYKVKFHAYDSSVLSHTLFHEDGDQYIFSKVWRSKKEEQNAISFLGRLGLTNTASEGFYLEAPENEAPEKDAAESNHQLWELVEWLGNNKDILEEQRFVIEQQTGKEPFHIGIPDLIVDVSEQTDWFDLKATVCFGEHRIPFLRLKNVILQGKREFLLPDGTIGLIPLQWIEKFTEVFRFATAKGDTISLKKHHFPLLEQISDQGLQVPDLSTALERFHPPELPASLQAELRPYQVQGYRWLCFLHEHNLGGCLADDMGLGKTIQTLALLARVHQGQKDESPFFMETHPDDTHALQPPYQLDLFVQPDHGAQRKHKALTLIIMPLSLIHNWIQEIRRFTPSLRVLQHTGSARASSITAFAGYDLVL